MVRDSIGQVTCSASVPSPQSIPDSDHRRACGTPGTPYAASARAISPASWRKSHSAQLQEQLGLSPREPFHVETGPVLQIHIFANSADEHALISVAQRLAIDRWP